MRGGGEEEQGVRTRGEQLGGAGAEGVVALAGAALGDVVGFVDDDDVPPGVFEVGAVFAVLLQGVDRDDGPVVVVERIVVRRDVAADALEAGGVKPGERDGEAGPDFLLELGEHRLDRDDEDAPAAAALDHLGEEDATLDGFPEADGVGDEESLAGLGQCQQRRIKLVGQDVHGSAVAEVEGRSFRCGGADLRLQDKAGLGVILADIGDGLGVPRIDDGDLAGIALDGVDKTGFPSLDQRRQADDSQDGSARGCAIDPADQPFFATDRDSGAGGEGGEGRRRCGCHGIRLRVFWGAFEVIMIAPGRLTVRLEMRPRVNWPSFEKPLKICLGRGRLRSSGKR